MPLTDAQWDAFAAAHPQEDFKLSLPEDIEHLWGQARDFFLDRQDTLRLPEAEEVCLWDTSDTDQADLIMTVDLPGGVRLASLTFSPTSLHTSGGTEEPGGSRAAREAIDALLAMRAEMVARAQRTPAPAAVTAQSLAELCARHGHPFRLSSDPTGTTELRVSWTVGHPSGVRSLHGVWENGEECVLRLRRRDPDTGLTDEEALTPAQAADILTSATDPDEATDPDPGGRPMVTAEALTATLLDRLTERLHGSAHVVVAENGAPGLGDPVVAVRVQPFVIDPETGAGLLGADAADHPGAAPALVLSTEH